MHDTCRASLTSMSYYSDITKTVSLKPHLHAYVCMRPQRYKTVKLKHCLSNLIGSIHLRTILLIYSYSTLKPRRSNLTGSMQPRTVIVLYSYSTSKRSLPASFTCTLLYSTNKKVHFEPHWLKPTARTRANRRLLLCYEASKAYHCYAMRKPL